VKTFMEILILSVFSTAMASTLLVHPSASHGETLAITPQTARWDLISLRVFKLGPGESQAHQAPGEELLLVLLGGHASISADGRSWDGLGGRANVFAGMPHALYLPVGVGRIEIAAGAAGCEIAVCGSRAERAFPARVIMPEETELEIRGGGNATRQINHLVKPDFPADRLL